MSLLSVFAVFVSLAIMSRALNILKEDGPIPAVITNTVQFLGVAAIMVTMLGLIVLTAEARVVF